MIWIPDGLKITGAATRAVTTNGAGKKIGQSQVNLACFIFEISFRILNRFIDEKIPTVEIEHTKDEIQYLK